MDSVHIGYEVKSILGVKLFREVCNVLTSCDRNHTEYDVTRIVCDVIQTVGVV